MNSKPHILKHLIIAIICLTVVTPKASAQSELIENGYDAAGVSVGFFITNQSRRSATDKLLGVAVGLSGNANFDFGVSYLRNVDRNTKSLTFSLAKHFSLSENGPGGFAIFGSIDAKEEIYGLGGRLYARDRNSSGMAIIPIFDLGVFLVNNSPVFGKRETKEAVSGGVSFVFGSPGGSLFVITPQISKLADVSTVYGISLSFFSVSKHKDSR